VPQRDLSLKHAVSKSVISVIKKNKENEAKPRIQICHYGGSALSVVRQARDCNFPLTREIIKAKEFAEKLSNEP
jgi:hypothetical protein